MDLIDLQEFSKLKLSELWGVTQIPPPPIEIKKLRKNLGFIELEFCNETSSLLFCKIVISEDVFLFGSNFLTKKILLHELCHFAMITKGLPFLDGDVFFENELKRIGTYSSKSLYTYYIVECSSCCYENIFPNKTAAKTFFKKSCNCSVEKKKIRLFGSLKSML